MSGAIGVGLVGDDWFLQAMALQETTKNRLCYKCEAETKYKCMNELPVKCQRHFCLAHMAFEPRYMRENIPLCCLECSLVRYEITVKAAKTMWMKRVLALVLFILCFLLPFILISVPGMVEEIETEAKEA